MKGFSFLIVLVLTVTVSASGTTEEPTEDKNVQQHGTFFMYKVKPKSQEEVAILLRTNTAYGAHPPAFLQPVKVHTSVLVLIEQSKVSFFEHVLKTHNIRHSRKGATLVQSIMVRVPEPEPRDELCDCDYHKGGCMISKPPPAGMACKCVYKTLLWTCTGYAFTCEPGVHCPANCSSYSCCMMGRGDCGGY